jgi:hypothetical protein
MCKHIRVLPVLRCFQQSISLPQQNASSGHPPAAAAQALNYFALRSALPATSMLPIDGRKKFSTLSFEGPF